MNIKKLVKLLDDNSDYLIWLIAVAGMFGSLYFSEVKHLEPCVLCWYQRILLYPFVGIYAVGILIKDRKVAYYGLPLAVLGTIVALYQSLLQWGVLKEDIVNCSAHSTVSCAIADINYFGFITIPFMSFVAFALITVLIALRIYLLRSKK